MSSPAAQASIRWSAFLIVCSAYLATTTGEAILSPIFPLASSDIGLDVTDAGMAFAVLAASIAAFNLVGGILLRHARTTRVLALALAATGIGSVVAATSNGSGQFLLAQFLIGGGAGLLYPGAVISVGTFAGPRRRGFAMGIFGVFFSGGLVLAAGLSALGTQLDWRWAFWLAAALAAIAAVLVLMVEGAPDAATTGPVFAGLTEVLGAPTIVGVIGGVSQYATVSFLPVFAVDVWGVHEAGAAGILAVGRVLSVPAKVVSGSAADIRGAIWTARATGMALAALGICWALSPWTWAGAVAAIGFAALVSALFPLANLLAFERVGSQGPAIGAFRSLQLAAGAAAGFALGAAADGIGLRSSIAVVAALPLLLAVFCRSSPAPRS